MTTITGISGDPVNLIDAVLETHGFFLARINAPSIPAAMLLVGGREVLVPGVHYTVDGTEITFTTSLMYTQSLHAINLATGIVAWTLNPIAPVE